MSHINKKVPKRRFQEFNNAVAWEQRKLEDILDVRSGRDYKHLDSGDIPVYGTGGYMLSVGEALSYEEDAIGIGRKGTIDKPYILNAPFWTVDTLFYTVPKRDSDLNFIHSIFQKINWKSKDESTGVPSLSKTTINAVSVFTPSCSEQKEIGTFFNKLDDTIALHQRKLQKLQNIKKAYLNEMFI
ncbi:type I restriction endonuclease subunit S [Listeria monocytogenes]|nr:type I restriction endonuclease subunit S [Listeria monocytogenes]